jgi:uncharacterized protein with NRDE domain
MCVLICRVGPDPLLAANRDEVYARPFSAPRRWVAPTPFWAPRDEEEGGTWIGVNANGLIAAITNRSLKKAREGRASRGRLVSGALARADLVEAQAWLHGELRGARQNPCQLLLMQGGDAVLLVVEGTNRSAQNLEPGIHVLSNLHEHGEIDFGFADDAGWSEMRPILADPSPRLPRDIAVCKRTPWRGTVASALIEPGNRFLFADGPPDSVEYEPVPDYPRPEANRSDS